MSTSTREGELAGGLADTAARWVLRRKEGLNAREEQELVDWLQADPNHRAAFEDSLRGWETAGLAASHPRLLGLRSEALMVRPARRSRMPLAAGLAALALVGATSAAFLAPWNQASKPSVAAAANPASLYQTAVGERSTVTLPDGSVVTLNTNSRLRVIYSRGARNLTLLAGQALFQVAHDPRRPFIVTARDRQIVATGTEFEVRLDRGSMRVALIEGHVVVRPAVTSPGDGPVAESARLAPGEQLVAQAGRVLSVSATDVADLTSWKEGRVRFQDTPLDEAAAEMNRYSTTPIVIDDTRAGQIRVSGAFRTGRSEDFAAAVASLFPVRASRVGGEIRLRSIS